MKITQVNTNYFTMVDSRISVEGDKEAIAQVLEFVAGLAQKIIQEQEKAANDLKNDTDRTVIK